jgi:hypothetical protein
MVNPMCKNCMKLGDDCNGTTCQTWTGCTHKVTARRMSELYTAHYSDGRTVREKPYEWICANAHGAKITLIRTIRLRKEGGAYLVEYDGNSVGCTLNVFDQLPDAEAYTDETSKLNEIEFKELLNCAILAKD